MCRILIVDDDMLLAMDLQEVLTAAGHQIDGLATSVDMALSLAERFRPDLAIVDILLEDRGHGIALAHKLQARWGIRSIILTGLPIDPQIDACAIVGWLTKPYNPKQLLALIDRHQPPGAGRKSVA